MCETSVLRVMKRNARIRTRERNVYLLLKLGATHTKKLKLSRFAILETETLVAPSVPFTPPHFTSIVDSYWDIWQLYGVLRVSIGVSHFSRLLLPNGLRLPFSTQTNSIQCNADASQKAFRFSATAKFDSCIDSCAQFFDIDNWPCRMWWTHPKINSPILVVITTESHVNG